MEKNLFEELRERKQKVLALASQAREYGWITAEREQEISSKIDKDVLTIGVIGQMKCGKSTVLNAIVFEDDVLPSATTPMTAALSVITYGPEKKLKAEFYTTNEWEEQKMQAARSLAEVEGNTLEESKVKAAKELVGKSARLGSAINSLLGTTKEDSLDNLEDYVGADGKYVSITKSVTIYYPKDYLKGVEIVDTPGFNDPIVSREERTKAFLNKADVVLLMLYAGRPFDATDRDILFKNVRQCGIGKVLVGINKYDIPYHNGEDEKVIKNYVAEEIEKACKECDDTTLVDILRDTDPIPLSAEMALLSELPMTKISASDNYQSAWKRYCDDFEISSQPQMMEKSHLDNLMAAIRKVIEKEKVEILLRKPTSAIINAGMAKKADIDKELKLTETLVDNLSQPDDEIEERQEKLRKADKRLNKKIDGLGDDIESELSNCIRRGRNTVEDDIDATCKKMDNIVEDMKRFKNPDSVIQRLDRELQTLVERTLKRHVEGIGSSAKNAIQKCVANFIDESSDIMLRYVQDFDSQDFLKGLKNEINFDIQNNDIFKFDHGNGCEESGGIAEYIYDFFQGFTFGGLGKFVNALSYNDNKKELHERIAEIRSVDVSDYLDFIMQNKDEIIEKVRSKIIDDVLTPLQQQLDNIVANKDKKEKELAAAKEKLGKLRSEDDIITKQLASINE